MTQAIKPRLQLCAICAERQATHLEPLGKNDAMVGVCDACADDTPVAKFGPERAYEGAGPSAVSDVEMTAAMRRLMGDAEYERQQARAKKVELSYEFVIRDGVAVRRSSAQVERIRKAKGAELDLAAVAVEGERLLRTGAKNASDKWRKNAGKSADRSTARRVHTEHVMFIEQTERRIGWRKWRVRCTCGWRREAKSTAEGRRFGKAHAAHGVFR